VQPSEVSWVQEVGCRLDRERPWKIIFRSLLGGFIAGEISVPSMNRSSLTKKKECGWYL